MHINYNVKVFTLHLIIVLLYLGITSYGFVVAKDHNPIGVGLQMWLCTLLHLGITITVMAFLWTRNTNKRAGRNKFLLNIGAIVLWIGISLIFSNPIWRWLWSFRS
jgi:hypothetical protein